jgi:hypothetical protein
MMEGLRLQTPNFLTRYQIGRVVVLSHAAKWGISDRDPVGRIVVASYAANPEILRSLRFVLGIPGQAVNGDYLFELGDTHEKNPPALGAGSLRVVAQTNLMVAYEARPDLQHAFPEVRNGNACALEAWAGGGVAGEPSLTPFAATYRTTISTAECNSKGAADVSTALRLLARSKVVDNPEKYREALLALRGVYDVRPDLQRAFPDWSVKELCRLSSWAASTGVRESPQYLLPFTRSYDSISRGCFLSN